MIEEHHDPRLTEDFVIPTDADIEHQRRLIRVYAKQGLRQHIRRTHQPAPLEGHIDHKL